MYYNEIKKPAHFCVGFSSNVAALISQIISLAAYKSPLELLLFLYSILMGIVITPLVLASDLASILMALVLAAVMFACMAMFGYKTAKDLSFLGIFLFMGMIGLLLVGIVSIFTGPFGTMFNQIVCLIGVLVFALFAAYDMQTLKNAYYAVGNGEQKDQLAVLGALHMYISFVALFEYILGLLNSRD